MNFEFESNEKRYERLKALYDEMCALYASIGDDAQAELDALFPNKPATGKELFDNASLLMMAAGDRAAAEQKAKEDEEAKKREEKHKATNDDIRSLLLGKSAAPKKKAPQTGGAPETEKDRIQAIRDLLNPGSK